jgi:2'-5' RNA ligase
MHGVVSLLPEPFYSQVLGLWKIFEQQYQLRGIYVTPYPHFSWQIGEHYFLDRLQYELTALLSLVFPLNVSTTGLGIFSGSSPVLYIPVVKSPQLMAVHQKLWTVLASCGEGISPYYAPAHWIPHISLAYGDITPQVMSALLAWLSAEDFSWAFTITNFSFIYEPPGQNGEVKFTLQQE